MRIKLIIEYDGTNYSGWQRQKDIPSVQQTVEDAFFEVSGERLCVHGAGRTDAGVHALGQVGSLETNCSIPPEKIAFAMNTKLPPDVKIRSSEEVKGRFHASMDAKGKHYRYTIYNDTHANAVLARYSAHIFYPMNIDKMNEAAKDLIGEHDFVAYSTAGSDIKTTVRTIYDLKVSKEGKYVFIDVYGSGFLYNMVRIIAGTLTDIGTGHTPVSRAKEALEKKDRKLCGMTMPAKGLTMVEVFY